MRAIMPDVGCFVVSGIVLGACWKLWSPPAVRPGSTGDDETPLQCMSLYILCSNECL